MEVVEKGVAIIEAHQPGGEHDVAAGQFDDRLTVAVLGCFDGRLTIAVLGCFDGRLTVTVLASVDGRLTVAVFGCFDGRLTVAVLASVDGRVSRDGSVGFHGARESRTALRAVTAAGGG